MCSFLFGLITNRKCHYSLYTIRCIHLRCFYLDIRQGFFRCFEEKNLQTIILSKTIQHFLSFPHHILYRIRHYFVTNFINIIWLLVRQINIYFFPLFRTDSTSVFSFYYFISSYQRFRITHRFILWNIISI